MIGHEVEAVIVDDIVMGSLISRVAELLRIPEGVSTRNCFSIFERADLGVQDLLADADLTLDSAFTIDDELVAALRQQAHAQG